MQNFEIFTLSLIIVITITSTTIFNYKKNEKDKNFINIANNIY